MVQAASAQTRASLEKNAKKEKASSHHGSVIVLIFRIFGTCKLGVLLILDSIPASPLRLLERTGVPN